jgi:hypothetical protein
MNTFDVVVNRLPPAEAEALFDRVQALDARVFTHRTEELQARYYAGMRDLSKADKIAVLYEEGTELVGYNLIKIQPLEVRGRTVWAVGSVAGFLPGYTGGNRTMLDAIQAMLRLKLRHPGREFFFVSFLINPGVYDMLVDLCSATFPSVHRPRPHGIEWEIIAAAAREWGIPLLHEEPSRIVGTFGRCVRELFPMRRDTESIRFFEALNPRHAEGELLGVCVPLDLVSLLRGGLRLLQRRLRKHAPGRIADLWKEPLAAR